MKTIKLFIFDNGGVMRVGENTLVRHFASLGYNFRNFASLGPNAGKAENDLNLGFIDEKQFWKEVDKDLVTPTSYETFLYDTKVSYPVSGMVEIVKNLRANGHRTVVGTNINVPYWERNISDGFYDCFDARYASCEMHVLKPDVAFYENIARAEGVYLSEVMLIDDTPANIESAKDAGMHTHLFENSFALRKELTESGYLN